MVTSSVSQPTSIHPLRRRNPNQDRYVWELRGAYAGIRVWDNDFAMSRDPWIYERMERDPLIRQCLWDRVSTVGGREWRIKPARKPNDMDKAVADIMEQCVSVLDYNGFHSSRINLARFLWYGATFGALYGGRVLKKFGAEWETRDEHEQASPSMRVPQIGPDGPQPQIGGLPPTGFMGDRFANFEEPDTGEQPDDTELPGTPREWWVPKRIRDLNKRRVRVWREGGEIKRTIERILDKNGEISYDRDPFPEDRIIAAIYDDQESGLGFGRGLADACYWPFKIRWKIREEGYEATNAWAQGVLHGKADAAAIGPDGSTDARDDFLEALKAMKARGVIVTGLTEEISAVDAMGSGAAQLLLWDQRYADDIRGLITGSKLPTGGGGEVGSMARAGEEAKTSEGQYQTDSDLLDDAMTSGLIKPIWLANHENWAELGLGEARMPFFVSDKERHESKEEKAATLTAAHAMGLDLVADEAYDMLGLTQPSDQDRERGNVIEAASDMPPGFDPFGDGFEDDGEGGDGSQGDQGQAGAAGVPSDKCPPGHERDRKGGIVGKCVPKKSGFGKEEHGANAASPFAHDAAHYAECQCADGAHFGAIDDFPDWITTAIKALGLRFGALIRAFAARVTDSAGGSPDDIEAAREGIRDTLGDAMAAGDLEGRADVIEDAKAAAEEEGETFPGEPEAEPVVEPDLERGPDGPTVVPRVPVGEAVQDVVNRTAIAPLTAQQVAEAYRKGPAFALAKSVDINLTRKVQEIVAETVKDQGGLARLGVDQIVAEADGFSRAYAETVVRTNVNTAITEGRFREARENPNVKAIIGAFELQTARDVDVRRGRPQDAIGKKSGPRENHSAAHGYVAGVNDPIWVKIASPAGYGCRCREIKRTWAWLRREGLVREDGTVRQRVPKGFGQYRRHPNFERTRMPGS